MEASCDVDSAHAEMTEYAIFNVGDIICGLDIKTVREIDRNVAMTPVHLAPDYVRGVINLRGQIVTVIDLHKRFNMPPWESVEQARIIVVRTRGTGGDEDIGLMVDGVDDIATSLNTKIDRPPPHIHDLVGRYLSGVYQMDENLVAVLDVEKLLNHGEAS